MEQTKYDLLAQIERGGHVFRPKGRLPEDRATFQAVVNHLLHLRDTGLIRLREERLMRVGDGSYPMAGPCYMTRAGVAALAEARSRTPSLPELNEVE